KFKRNKGLGYVLLGGAIASLCSWSYVSANYMVKNDEYGIKPFLKWQHLPFLGAYFVCFYSSIHLNLKSDLNLKKAVRIYNRS
ncbi:MAG: hypothetical protein WCR52_12985, partial [Bacteroidota bacterium]